MTDYINRFYEWKSTLNLPNPGTFENIHREARNVSLSNVLFDGAKADLSKGLSPNFQVSHSYTLGSMMIPPSYHFGAIYVNGQHLLHGMLDTNRVFQGKYHYTVSPKLTTKIQVQITPQAGQSMAQLEAEYLGQDHSTSIKAINPDIADGGSGIYTASYLQSFSKNFSAGFEIIGQKGSRMEPIEYGGNVGARYATSNWSAAINLQQMVALQATYFQKVSEHVELGSELQMLLIGAKRDAIASMAAKFDYRQAIIRTQIDSTAKVSLVYEERLFPGFSLILSGELDHIRNSSRFGFGINLEN